MAKVPRIRFTTDKTARMRCTAMNRQAVVKRSARSSQSKRRILRWTRHRAYPSRRWKRSNKYATDVERLLRQQAALAKFGSFAFRETDLLRILNEAARICADSLNVPFCKVVRYRSKENDLLVEAAWGWDSNVIGRVVSPADTRTPQGRAYITGEPVIIRNLNAANNLSLPAFYGQHGIVSTIDVLIKSDDGPPYGVLEVDSPTPIAYDGHAISFLTGFANVLAEAVATQTRTQALRRSS